MGIHARNDSQLQIVLNDLREQLLSRISYNMPHGYFALGPAVMYIEDSHANCLYNWSSISWDDAKLGRLLKELLRELVDITELFIRSSDYVYEDVQAISRSILKKCKKYLNMNIDIIFDDYPLFYHSFERKGEFSKFIKKVTNLYELIQSYNLLSDRKLSTYINLNTPNLLIKAFNLNRCRYVSILDLKQLMQDYKDTKIIKHVEKYIIKHPNYPHRAQALKRWKAFNVAINAFDPEHNITELDNDKYTDYCSVISATFQIFSDMPQEVESSKALTELRKINAEQYARRNDTENINIGDLTFNENNVDYEPDSFITYKMYYLTYHFERIFYNTIISNNKTTSQIDHALFIPIKYFDFQVIGQIIIITPDPVDKNYLMTSVENYRQKIREAVKSDFQNDMIRRTISALKEDENIIPDPLELLARCVRKIISYQQLIAFKYKDNRWVSIIHTENVPSSLDRNILRFSSIITDDDTDQVVRSIENILNSNSDINYVKVIDKNGIWNKLVPNAQAGLLMVFGDEDKVALFMSMREDGKLLKLSSHDIYQLIYQFYSNSKLQIEWYSKELESRANTKFRNKIDTQRHNIYNLVPAQKLENALDKFSIGEVDKAVNDIRDAQKLINITLVCLDIAYKDETDESVMSDIDNVESMIRFFEENLTSNEIKAIIDIQPTFGAVALTHNPEKNSKIKAFNVLWNLWHNAKKTYPGTKPEYFEITGIGTADFAQLVFKNLGTMKDEDVKKLMSDGVDIEVSSLKRKKGLDVIRDNLTDLKWRISNIDVDNGSTEITVEIPR